jgi:hypothetical protein
MSRHIVNPGLTRWITRRCQRALMGRLSDDLALEIEPMSLPIREQNRPLQRSDLSPAERTVCWFAFGFATR